MSFLKGFVDGFMEVWNFVWTYKWYIISIMVIAAIIKGVNENKKKT